MGARRYLPWAAYVAASLLGALAAADLTLTSGFAPWYPQVAFAMAALLIGGWRVSPLVFATLAVSGRLAGLVLTVPDVLRQDMAANAARALVVTVVYTGGAEVLRAIGLRRAHVRELGWLALVGVIAAPGLAAGGIGALAVTMDGLSRTAAGAVARRFWIGESVAVATFVPFILLLDYALREGPLTDRLPEPGRDRLEAVVQGMALILVPVLAGELGEHDRVTPLVVFSLLPVLWVAVRRDLLAAAAGVVVLNCSLAVIAARVLDNRAALADVQLAMLASALAAGYVGASLRSRSDARLSEAAGAERYEALVRSSPDLIVRFDRDGGVLSTNRDVPELAAAIASQWATRGASAWEAPRPEVHDWSRESLDGVHWYRTRIEVERGIDGAPEALVSVTTDTTAIRAIERTAAEAIARDAVTGLASTAALLEFCAQRWASLDGDRSLTLVVIDLDRFRSVREEAGSDAVDGLLQRAGQLLSDQAPADAVVARTGDSEFTVAAALSRPELPDAATDLGERLLGAIRAVDRRGRSDMLTASVGVAVADNGPADPADLLADARLAVRAAKELGRDRVLRFDREHRRAATDRKATLDALRRALDEGEFRVLYQPEVRLDTEELLGVEALVRWARPGKGLLPPNEFLGLAERSGLIVELGAQVLDTAVAQLAAWQDRAPRLTMAVNVSANQLVSDHFVAIVADTLARHGIDPVRLTLELTETSLLADPTAAGRNLASLRELGCRLALDDFGAGYASIGYLRTLPLDLVKIDQSFVAGLPDSPEDLAIVRFVIGLAESLGLEVTAEGIERPEQATALVELGCNSGQGFLFDHAVTPAAVETRFPNGSRSPQ